jgi:hypothetical protein
MKRTCSLENSQAKAAIVPEMPKKNPREGFFQQLKKACILRLVPPKRQKIMKQSTF